MLYSWVLYTGPPLVDDISDSGVGQHLQAAPGQVMFYPYVICKFLMQPDIVIDGGPVVVAFVRKLDGGTPTSTGPGSTDGGFDLLDGGNASAAGSGGIAGGAAASAGVGFLDGGNAFNAGIVWQPWTAVPNPITTVHDPITGLDLVEGLTSDCYGITQYTNDPYFDAFGGAPSDEAVGLFISGASVEVRR